eukprot:9046788-Ditylum_brightwellii.AAC.1
MFSHLLFVLATMDPDHGPVFTSKTDLLDAYMRVWLQLEDAPYLASVVPAHPSNTNPVVAFHLSVPMGWIDSA